MVYFQISFDEENSRSSVSKFMKGSRWEEGKERSRREPLGYRARTRTQQSNNTTLVCADVLVLKKLI
jgi:hypothetical protein